MQQQQQNECTMLALAIAMFAIVVLVLSALSGCAPSPHRRPTLADTKLLATPAPVAQSAPAPVPESVNWQPVYEPSPPPQRKVEARRPVPSIAAGGKIIVYDLGQKYPLYCPEFGTLTIIMPEGEWVQGFNSGASGEWQVDKTVTGFERETGVITIKRTPQAPRAELHVIADGGTYQFILIPTKGGVSNGQPSLIQLFNPETEARRAEMAAARAEREERRRREAAERAAVPYDYVRAYRLGSPNGAILNGGGAH